MCIFHDSPDGFFLSRMWVSHSLGLLCFRLFAAAADIYIFHTSPDGFFWAVCEYFIFLDRYAFDYSQQLLMFIYFIIPRMDSFEQHVSISFSWIVMFFDYSQQLLMCIYFIIPRMDSFEQAVSLPFSWIVMFSIIRSSCWCVYFMIPPGWILLSSGWVCHSLGSLCFRLFAAAADVYIS